MKTVVGLFSNFEEADKAIFELSRLGLSSRQIGVLSSTSSDVAAARRNGMDLLDLPGLGKVAANAPMLGLLDARSVRGDPEGVRGMLLRMGISEHDAAEYIDGIRRGGVFEALEIEDDKAADVLAIMRQRSNGTPETQRYEREIVIPLVEEELFVDRAIESDGVRVETHVSSRPVEKTITIREEHVSVKRRKVDHELGADLDPFYEQDFELKATMEEPVVTKRARVVEEIRIHKARTERVETIRDTLRHTEVEIKDLPGGIFDAARHQEHFRRFYEPQRYSLETVAPAYEFGERLRRESKSGDWSSVENEASQAWERHNPGTWARFKDAIRAGWDNVIRH